MRIKTTKSIFISTINNSAIHILLLISLSLPCLFWNLGETSLRDLDEALQAQISKEILTTGNWLTLHIRNQTFFHKSPIIFSLNALNFLIFGINESTARLWSALSGLGTIIFTYLLAKKLYTNSFIGLLSSLILLTSSQFLFERGARAGEEDMLSICLLVLSFLLFWHSRKNNQYIYLSSICIGLAILIRGPLSLLYASILGIYLISNKELKLFNTKQLFIALIIIFSIPTTWYITELILTKQNFFKIYLAEIIYFCAPSSLQEKNLLTTFLGANTIARISTEVTYRYTRLTYYLQALNFGFFPWSIIFPFAICSFFAKDEQNQNQNRFLLIWTIIPFLILSTIPIKNFWRYSPALPAIAIITANFLIKSIVKKKQIFLFCLLPILLLLLYLKPIQYEITYHTCIPYLDTIWDQRIKINFNFILLIYILMTLVSFSLNKQLQLFVFKPGLKTILYAIVLGYLILIATKNTLNLLKKSTYKSAIHLITTQINQQYSDKTLIIYDPQLFRMQYDNIKPEFPMYSDTLVDTWSDYFYLNNLSNKEITFIKNNNSPINDLRGDFHDSQTKIFLTNKANFLALKNQVKSIHIITKQNKYILFEL